MVKLNVFVACPYSIFPLQDYKRVFSDTQRLYEVAFKSADERITNQQILSKVTNYIRDNDFSLFDITGWNPNVALELGIAVGLGRKYFILLNTHIDRNREAPSDIRGIDRIQYESYEELGAKLAILTKQELPASESRSESTFVSLKTIIGQILGKNPGIGVAEISRIANEEKPIIQSVVYAMVKNQEVKTQGQKKGTTYYLSDFDFRTLKRKRN